MKQCLKCKTILSVEMFNKDKSSKDGLKTWCKECRNTARKEQKAGTYVRTRPFIRPGDTTAECRICETIKPIDVFTQQKETPSGRTRICKPCAASKVDKDRQKNNKLIRLYDLTTEQWNTLFESQGSMCAICRSDQPNGAGWNTDHDHSCCPGIKTCGVCVRGILCAPCNQFLGWIEKGLQLTVYEMVQYLEYWTKEHAQRRAAQIPIN